MKMGRTPLLLACQDNIRDVAYLLKQRADFNHIQDSKLDVVNLLLKSGTDINHGGDETPLTAACQNGNVQLVNRLLTNNPAPNLNQTNKAGLTPVEIAIKSGHSMIVTTLIKKRCCLYTGSCVTLQTV